MSRLCHFNIMRAFFGFRSGAFAALLIVQFLAVVVSHCQEPLPSDAVFDYATPVEITFKAITSQSRRSVSVSAYGEYDAEGNGVRFKSITVLVEGLKPITLSENVLRFFQKVQLGSIQVFLEFTEINWDTFEKVPKSNPTIIVEFYFGAYAHEQLLSKARRNRARVVIDRGKITSLTAKIPNDDAKAAILDIDPDSGKILSERTTEEP